VRENIRISASWLCYLGRARNNDTLTIQILVPKPGLLGKVVDSQARTGNVPDESAAFWGINNKDMLSVR
jgi:hypothetical protein